MPRYRVGSALDPIGTNGFLIAHVCNDKGGWGAGFVVPLAVKWPQTKQLYHTLTVPITMGTIQYVPVSLPGRSGVVANMVAQTLGTAHPLDLAALKKCIALVTARARQQCLTIHAPRLGAGLGGEKWEKIEPLLPEEWVIYTLPHEVVNFPKVTYEN